MGILCCTVIEDTTTMIKAAIVACLAALSAAEAEADALYGNYGYAAGLGYSGYGYAAAPYRYNGAYGYAAPATGAGITVRGYGTPATVGTYAPYGYAASGQYVADSFGAVHIAKREAEAEPEADADALYGTYGHGLGLGYSAGYGLGYSRPIYGGYSTISSYAAPAIATGYAGLGYSRAIYGGYGSYYGKRDAEAEPEAEADAVYGTYGGYGLGYSSYAGPAVASYAAPAVASYAAPVISRPAIASYAAPAIATGYAGIARPAISSYAGYGYGRLYKALH